MALPAAATLAALAGCSAGGDSATGASASPTPTSSASASAGSAPAASASAAEHYRWQGDRILQSYPDAREAGQYSSASSTPLEIPAADTEDPTFLVMLLTCTGSGEYSLTVQQANPNTVGATCGDDGTAIAAVPLDDASSPVPVDLKVPADSNYWLTAYYARKDT